MGWQFGIPSGLNLSRTERDNVPQKISLNGFSVNPDQLDIVITWANFLDRSRNRTKAHLSLNLSSYDKIFRTGYEDFDDINPDEK